MNFTHAFYTLLVFSRYKTTIATAMINATTTIRMFESNAAEETVTVAGPAICPGLSMPSI